MRRVWIAVVGLVCSACAPMAWVRPDATPEMIAADEQFCQQQAWREASSYSMAYRPFGPWLDRGAYGGAFYHSVGPFYDPYYDLSLEQQRLENFCMRSRGYDLAPAAK
jgi:hypothetical protein